MEINRQYVGARYVPKFYEGSNGTEWDENHIYEPLTIVTYLGNSYTSKKSVPAAIGNPMSNSEYWAATGNYNAQVEQYREEVVAIDNKIKKFGAVITPQMYGAKGDGVTDDTNAFKQAIIAATNEYEVGNPWDINPNGYAIGLHIPAGEYLISDTIMVNSMLYIYGDGEGSTKIISAIDNGKYVFEIDKAKGSSASNDGVYNVVIRDLSIHGRGLNCNGIYISGAFNKLFNVTINRCRNAVYLYSAYTCVIEDCHFTYNSAATGSATITCNGTNNGTGCHNLRINNCTLQGNTIEGINTGVCFNLIHGNGIEITDSDIESFEVGFNVTSNCVLNVARIYFEGVTKCFTGELLGNSINDCFVTACSHFIIANVIRGCSIIGNYIGGNIANHMIEAVTAFSYLTENYIVGNFSSGYEATLSTTALETLESDSSNYMRTNYGHEYGTIKQYVTIALSSGTIASMLDRYSPSIVGTIGFNANRDNGATDLPEGGWFRGIANKLPNNNWLITLTYIDPSQITYMYYGLYNGTSITWRKVAYV